jgi:hypothetical protein
LCARSVLNQDQQVLLTRLVSQQPNWSAIFDLGTRHGLLPLLFTHLKRFSETIVPQDIWGRLTFFARLTAKTNVLYAAELLKVKQIFDAHGLDFVVFKGPCLAVQAYGNLSMRSFSDIDVIVAPEDALKAQHSLMRAGYAPLPKRDPALFDALTRSGLFLKLAHEQSFGRNEGGRSEPSFIVDVHWQAGEQSVISVDFDWLRDHSQEIALSGQSLRSPDSLSSIILLCVHGSKHQWELLKWLTDIAELLRVTPTLDWHELYGLADRFAVRRKIDLMLLLLHRMLGIHDTIPDTIISRLEQDAVLCSLAQRTAEVWFYAEKLVPTSRAYWSYQIATADSCVGAARFLLRDIFTPTVPTYLRCPLSPSLFPFYFAAHPWFLISDFWAARLRTWRHRFRMETI